MPNSPFQELVEGSDIEHGYLATKINKPTPSLYSEFSSLLRSKGPEACDLNETQNAFTEANMGQVSASLSHPSRWLSSSKFLERDPAFSSSELNIGPAETAAVAVECNFIWDTSLQGAVIGYEFEFNDPSNYSDFPINSKNG